MIDYWTALRDRRGLSRGKANARENMKLVSLLKGKGENARDSITPLLLRELGAGLSLALCAFGSEIIARWIRKVLVMNE